MNLVNLRDFLGAAIKFKESIFKKNNQIKFTVTTRTWVLSTEWTTAWPITGLVPDKKMVVVPVCLNVRCCSSECEGIVSY